MTPLNKMRFHNATIVHCVNSRVIRPLMPHIYEITSNRTLCKLYIRIRSPKSTPHISFNFYREGEQSLKKRVSIKIRQSGIFRAPWIEKVNFSGENFEDTALLLSDYCVSLQSFHGEEKVNEVYKDYHGLLNIHKTQSLASLGPPNMLIQDPSQLVFKSKRTKFLIEKFHLPPDLSENVSRDNTDKTLKQSSIDF